ncbi:MAG TPA: hypothetical protein VHI11_10605 [Jiangellaceae bacterium]|nr:hypothetical protein [Jiangellaceae bacterium]
MRLAVAAGLLLAGGGGSGAGEQRVGGVEPQLVQGAGPAVGPPPAGEIVDGGVTGRGLLHRAGDPEHAVGVPGIRNVPDPAFGPGVRSGLFGPGRACLQHRAGGAQRPLPHRPPRPGRTAAVAVFAASSSPITPACSPGWPASAAVSRSSSRACSSRISPVVSASATAGCRAGTGRS